MVRCWYEFHSNFTSNFFFTPFRRLQHLWLISAYLWSSTFWVKLIGLILLMCYILGSIRHVPLTSHCLMSIGHSQKKFFFGLVCGPERYNLREIHMNQLKRMHDSRATYPSSCWAKMHQSLWTITSLFWCFPLLLPVKVFLRVAGCDYSFILSALFV